MGQGGCRSSLFGPGGGGRGSGRRPWGIGRFCCGALHRKLGWVPGGLGLGGCFGCGVRVDGGLQVHGLCNHRFAHKKVVEDFYRAIRDLTCGALVIPLVVIRLGVTGPKKTRFVCLLDVFLSPKSLLFFYK